MQKVDLALIGFGAAAMSLLIRLAPDFKGRVAVIEPRDLPRDDQTWCGWPLSAHPFSAHATQRWQRWAVSHEGQEVIRSGGYNYEMLSAHTVQSLSLQAVQQRRDWTYFGSTSLVQARYADKQWALELDTGDTLYADYVLDSRPPSVNMQRPWLWQSFIGREIQGPCEADRHTVRLMDFIDGGDAVVTFLYELPLATDHRLIEITQFTPTPADPDRLNHLLDEQLAARGLSDAKVVRSEQGHLPMQPIAPYHHQQWLKIGTAGGSMRPATGYAFHTIQDWADRCAAVLLKGQAPIAPKRAYWMDWLDGVFLESLWQAPEQASERFLALFERAKSDALTRFLMGKPKPSDLLAVMSALPTGRLLKAAVKRGFKTT